MREQVGEVAIVRDDEQPFAILVEPAHVVNARPVAGQEGENRFALLGVVGSAQVSAWFVEDGVDDALGAKELAADFHGIGGLHLCGEIGDDVAINPDDAGFD